MDQALAVVEGSKPLYQKPDVEEAGWEALSDWGDQAEDLSGELHHLTREILKEDDLTRLWQLGELGKAAASLLSSNARGRVCTMLGNRFIKLGNYLDALHPIEEAVERLRDSKEPVTLIALDRRSTLLLQLRRYEEAEPAAQEFLAMARALGNRASEAMAGLDVGRVHAHFGRREEAIKSFQEAIQARKVTEPEEADDWGAAPLDDFLMAYGAASRSAAHYEEAINAFRQAYEARLQEGRWPDAAFTLSEMGFTHFTMQEHAKGMHYLQRAVAMAEEHGMSKLATRWSAAMKAGKAMEQADPSKPVPDADSDSDAEITDSSEAYTMSTRADALLASGNFPAARKILLRCLAWAKQSDDKELELICRANLSGSYSKEQKLFQAKAAAEAACRLAMEINNIPTLLQMKYNLANILSRMGKWEDAEREIKEGVDLAGKVMASATSMQARQSVREGVSILYEELAFLLSVTRDPKGGAVLRTGRHEEMLACTQIIRSGNLGAWISLEDAFESRGSAELSDMLLDLRRIETQLEVGSFSRTLTAGRSDSLSRDRESLISRINALDSSVMASAPAVSTAELEALLQEAPCMCIIDLFTTVQFVIATRARIVGGRLELAGRAKPWMRKDRHNLMEEWQRATARGGSRDLIPMASAPTDRKKPEAEIEPLIKRTEEIFGNWLADLIPQDPLPSQVVFVTHRELHAFPFWLLSRRFPDITLSLVPNLKVFRQLRSREREDDGSALFVPDRTGTLKHVKMESDLVKSSRPRCEIAPPQTELFLESCRNAALIHVACHGVFNSENPYLSGLVALEDDPSTIPQEFSDLCAYDPHDPASHHKLLTVAEIMARCRLSQCRLVILSACRSGLPRDHAADEFISLPGSLLIAGARGVIATLWPVNDLATFLLMKHFYAAWRGSGGDASPSQALSIARRSLEATPREDVLCIAASADEVPAGDFPFAGAYYTMPFQYYGAG